MKSRTTRVVLLVVIAVTVLSGVTSVAATHDHGQIGGADELRYQQDDAQNATDTENASADDTEVVRKVDEDVRVLSYSYDAESETFRVELENTGDRTARVTLTEVLTPQRAEGDGTFGITVIDVGAGETVTAKVNVKREGLDAVMILTDASVENGQGTFLSVEEGGSIFKGSATWNDVRAGAFAALLFLGLIVIIGAWHHVATKNTDVEDVEVTS